MTALILVDIQNDFMPGGSLPVPNGFDILPTINDLLSKKFDIIIASKDWHPPNHKSFAETHGKKTGEFIQLEGLKQILWPHHCVQMSWGAEFAPGWSSEKAQKIIYKGTDVNIDSYSVFFDNARKKATGLAGYLKEHAIQEIHIVGLATDYCVKYSVLDALELGFKVYVHVNGCRGVNLQAKDSDEALLEMKLAGAHLL